MTVMDERVLLLDIGCAECGDEPLVTVEGVFSSLEAAQEAVSPRPWKPHPQGGVIHQTGSGGQWLVPAYMLTAVST